MTNPMAAVFGALTAMPYDLGASIHRTGLKPKRLRRVRRLIDARRYGRACRIVAFATGQPPLLPKGYEARRRWAENLR